MKIRRAVPGDEAGIARVHIESWESTYRGLFPDEILDNETRDKRIRLWTEVLRRNESINLVAVDEKNGIVGFVSGSQNRELDKFPEYESELFAIYIIEAFQRQGVGKALTSALVHEFLDENINSMMLWVAKGNAAERFYEAMGGQKLAEEAKEFRGHIIDHIAYGWRDIRELLSSE